MLGRYISPFRRSVRLVFLLVAALSIIAGRHAISRAQTAPVPLVAGWNNIAYQGPAQPVTAALAAISGQYDALWRFDAAAQRWRSFDPQSPNTSDFTDLTQGAAYWIHMLAPAILSVGLSGAGASDNRGLSSGWNNVVQTGGTADVLSALAPYKATFTAVWHWNAALQRWELFDPSNPSISDFPMLVQGQAYFVQVVSSSPAAAAPVAVSCYSFDSYQPQIPEVADALTRAGVNALTDDPSFRLAALHISPAGGPETMPGYIPPTLLKAISWLESGWRQATYSVSRGNRGKTITSRECAYGLVQVLTGMQVNGTPTARQNQVGTDYAHNAAAGAQILLSKWNMAPTTLPVYGRRDPRIIEDWYFATWAYHCFGDICSRYDVHNNPDDPLLKWPRPSVGTQAYKDGPFTYADYPYQELIFGLIANPPLQNGVQLWQPVPVLLPPHGTIGFPSPNSTIEASAHLEGGQALAVPTPVPTVTPPPSATATPAPYRTASPTPRPGNSTYYPPVGSE